MNVNVFVFYKIISSNFFDKVKCKCNMICEERLNKSKFEFKVKQTIKMNGFNLKM